jgi:cation diffusion facilitator family transporter
LYDNIAARSLYRDASRAAWIGLAINFVLGIAKLIGGVLGSSFALISDAVNSLGDTFTSLVVVFAPRYAQRPADKEHPYGHTRAEAIAASNLALLIVLSALYVGWEAITRIHLRHAAPPIWTLWLAATNVLIKETLYQYKLRIGRRTGSAAIVANAWDHRSDALCSLAVLAGLSVVRWGGPDYVWADEVAALFVVAAIVYSGVKLFRGSVSELLDPQADADLLSRIRDVAVKVPGVHAVEKLWVRKSGLEYLADIHLEVNGQLTVEEGHRIGHAVKDRLQQEFDSLRHVLVHIEPARGQ